MNQHLTQRKATIEYLRTIVNLLLEDDFGKTREQLSDETDQCYIDAFHRIDIDSNQYLMVVMLGDEIVGTCHLTIAPSLTFKGQTRMNIEAVRVSAKHRGKGIGEWMMKVAIEYGKSRGASIMQLATNKQRTRAKEFYENLGFKASHEGMKIYLERAEDWIWLDKLCGQLDQDFIKAVDEKPERQERPGLDNFLQ